MKHKIPFRIKLNFFMNFWFITSLSISVICLIHLVLVISPRVINDFKLSGTKQTINGVIVDMLYHENQFYPDVFEYVYEYTTPNNERVTSFSFSDQYLNVEMPEPIKNPNVTPKGIEAQNALLKRQIEQILKRREVTIEYHASNPYNSRITGMRTTFLGFYPLRFLWLLIPMLWILYRKTKSGFRKIRVVNNGVLAWANFTSKRDTGTKVNEQRMFEMVYNYSTEAGTEHTIKAKTLDPKIIRSQKKQAVLYNSKIPAEAFLVFDLWKTLPNSLRDVFPEYHSKPN